MLHLAVATVQTASTPAGVITAIASIIAAIGGLLVAFPLFLARMKVLLASINETGQKVDDVHVIVNQQRTDLQRYQVALVTALKKANVEVPEDQSIIPLPTPAAPNPSSAA